MIPVWVDSVSLTNSGRKLKEAAVDGLPLNLLYVLGDRPHERSPKIIDPSWFLHGTGFHSRPSATGTIIVTGNCIFVSCPPTRRCVSSATKPKASFRLTCL